MRSMVISLLTIFELSPLKKTLQNAIAILKLEGSIIVCYNDVCILMNAGIYYVPCLISMYLFFVINKIMGFYGSSIKKCLNRGKNTFMNQNHLRRFSNYQCPPNHTTPHLHTHTHAFKDVSTAEGWKEWSAPVFWKSSSGGSDAPFLKVENHFKSCFFLNLSSQSLKTFFFLLTLI